MVYDVVMDTKKYTQLINFIKTCQCHVYEYGHVKGDSQWRWHNITSPFHRLYYIKNGKVHLRDEHRSYTLMAGDLYLIRRNTWMDYYAEGAFEKVYFHLNYYSDTGYDYLDYLSSVVKVPFKGMDMAYIQEAMTSDYYTSQGAILSFLYGVLDRALQTYPPEDSDRFRGEGAYDELVKEMIGRCRADFTVEAMAQYCGQSTADFSRKFKEERGLSPKHFLHELLIEKGKMLLLTTDLPVKGIAIELGFEDNLYFSRFFRQRVGLSPQKYRRSQMA